jgi:hypothetical protein
MEGELWTTVHKVSNLNVNHVTVAEISGSVKTFVEGTKHCCKTTENTQIQPFKNAISLPNILNCSDSTDNLLRYKVDYWYIT